MLTFFFSQARFFPLALLLTVLFCMSYIFIKNNKGEIINKLKELFKSEFLFVLFVFYTALILSSTIFARPATNPYTHLIDFFLYDGWGNVSIVGILNILMFVPYTYIYILAFNPNKPFAKSIQLTIATTLLIEFYQLLFWTGQFSLADMTHNIIGGIIGCGLWHLVKIIKEKRHNKQ